MGVEAICVVVHVHFVLKGHREKEKMTCELRSCLCSHRQEPDIDIDRVRLQELSSVE